jgi:hypothetical protein
MHPVCSLYRAALLLLKSENGPTPIRALMIARQRAEARPVSVPFSHHACPEIPLVGPLTLTSPASTSITT